MKTRMIAELDKMCNGVSVFKFYGVTKIGEIQSLSMVDGVVIDKKGKTRGTYGLTGWVTQSEYDVYRSRRMSSV